MGKPTLKLLSVKYIGAGAFMLASGVLAVMYVTSISAQTPIVSVEAENGQPQGTAKIYSDSSASGGKSIAFTSGILAAKYAPPQGKTYIGASLDYVNLSAFKTAAGITTHPAIINSYLTDASDLQIAFDRIKTQPGVAPMISWNVTFTGDAITSGSQDAYLQRAAQQIKAYGKPVFLRLNWEMNGSWYTNYSTPGTTPAQYIASWQYIQKIIKTTATNAAFVWCPNVGTPNSGKLDYSQWYPGDSYVSWTCMDVYPEYSSVPANVITETDGLNAIAQFSLDHKKPLMIGEWARGNSSLPPDTSISFDTIFGWTEQHTDVVKALLYFDYPNNGHKLETHPIGAAAYRNYTVNNPRYLYDIVP